MSDSWRDVDARFVGCDCGLCRRRRETRRRVPFEQLVRDYRCEACDVAWTGTEHCWSCGEPGEHAVQPFIKDQEIAPYGWH